MKLGIGIDTGGTYTDAVIYNFDDQNILGSAKSLTTKQDLTLGILGAIDGLPLDLVKQAEVISLSTTLATNACVEDKSGRAKLIFWGGDKNVIDKNGPQYGLPPSSDMYIQESYSRFSGGFDRDPDWDLFQKQIQTGFENLDGVGIIEMNAMRNGAVVEKRAKELFQQQYDIPVVCSHELFSELNCLQRGSSTLLNAGLFPVIEEFLKAVKKALTLRDIHPKAIVIVRSDGSLMSETYASIRPVETLLCGPAASAIGCTRLSKSPNNIVVDMGGTTTDIAFINNGTPVTVTNGVSIGRWKTFVNGLYVKTFGLGGDTAIHYNGYGIYLEDYRVIPLCTAAAEHPSILENLRNLPVRKHTKFLYEHYILIKDISENPRYTDFEKDFCAALKEKPLLISDAAAAVGKDIYTLRIPNLLKEGIVQICGLTPTDIMHLKGDFNRYNLEASRLAASFVAHNLDISVEELCGRVYNEVKKKLYVNIVKALLENKYPDYMKNGINADVERFILANYEAARTDRQDALFSTMFHTNYTLVGMGAPIQVFLKDVADMLGTQVLIPEHHEVANALGAIIGSISATYSIPIKPTTDPDAPAGFITYGTSGAHTFESLEEAIAYARTEAEEQARLEAINRGVVGEIHVTSEVQTSKAAANGAVIYMGTTVVAVATGTMGF